MKPVRTWVLLADGTQARILLNEGPGKGIRQLNGKDYGLPTFASAADYSDRPGRVQESHGTARHGVEARETPCDAGKRVFAEQLAQVLALNVENYDRLVIAASPGTLGVLRDALSDGVGAKVHGTIAKDLVGTPTNKVADFLGEVMVV